MERKFTHYVVGEYPDQETMYPSTDDAHSKPHKIFVRGSILFSAVDGDLDGYIGADEGSDQTTVNLPEFDEAETESGEEAVGERFDFAYYYLDDARGRVMALLARDVEAGVTPPYIEHGPETEEANLPRILEYYTYNAFGTVTALPVQDRAEAAIPGVDSSGWYHAVDGYYPGSGSLGQWDQMEDTPLDLSDNATLMLNRRNGDNNHVAGGESYGRESAWANQMVSSGRRWVAEVGVEFQEVGTESLVRLASLQTTVVRHSSLEFQSMWRGKKESPEEREQREQREEEERRNKEIGLLGRYLFGESKSAKGELGGLKKGLAANCTCFSWVQDWSMSNIKKTVYRYRRKMEHPEGGSIEFVLCEREEFTASIVFKLWCARSATPVGCAKDASSFWEEEPVTFSVEKCNFNAPNYLAQNDAERALPLGSVIRERKISGPEDAKDEDVPDYLRRGSVEVENNDPPAPPPPPSRTTSSPWPF